MDRPWLDEAERNVLTLASVDLKSGMGGIWIYAGTGAGLFLPVAREVVWEN